jgi:hypothetical protein
MSPYVILLGVFALLALPFALSFDRLKTTEKRSTGSYLRREWHRDKKVAGEKIGE